MSGRIVAYRFGLFGRPKAPWRETLEEAKADALDAGYASRDEHSDMVWITVPAEIWSTADPVATEPRSIAPRNGPSCDPTLSRIDRIIARRNAQIPA